MHDYRFFFLAFNPWRQRGSHQEILGWLLCCLPRLRPDPNVVILVDLKYLLLLICFLPLDKRVADVALELGHTHPQL